MGAYISVQEPPHVRFTLQGIGYQADYRLLDISRLHVHTQLPFIYVGTQTITNCLCRWEPSAAPYSWCIPPCRQSPGPARMGAVPGGSGGRLAFANYLRGSDRLHVHTQLPIIYVGAHTNTNCLCTWEPPRPNIAGAFPPSPRCSFCHRSNA